MDVGLDFDRSLFESTMARLLIYSKTSMEEEMRKQGRLFIIDVVKVTPPFHQGAGQSASVAKKAGEKSIRRNMDRVFIGRTLVGTRQVTHLFGRTDVEGLPYAVPTKERHPDVAGIYAREKKRGMSGGSRKLRLATLRLPVSRRKVERIYRDEVRKVGYMAGGWGRAVAALDATGKVPAFVRRHSSAPGGVVLDFSARHLRIVVSNEVRSASRINGLQRRLAFAVRKRIDSMQRQIPHLMRAAARELRRGGV